MSSPYFNKNPPGASAKKKEQSSIASFFKRPSSASKTAGSSQRSTGNNNRFAVRDVASTSAKTRGNPSSSAAAEEPNALWKSLFEDADDDEPVVRSVRKRSPSGEEQKHRGPKRRRQTLPAKRGMMMIPEDEENIGVASSKMDVDSVPIPRKPTRTSFPSSSRVGLVSPTREGSANDIPVQAALDMSAMSLSSAKNPEIPVALQRARRAARHTLGAVEVKDVGRKGKIAVEGEWIANHRWARDIKDSKRRRPGEPGYDPTTLYIPQAEFTRTGKGALTPMVKQYWKMKMNNYDVVLFIKKGRFYEAWDLDADMLNKELNLTYTKCNGTEMHTVGVPEIGFNKWVSKLLDRGYKVGRVEQTETPAAAALRKSSLCERTLVRILSKATATDETLLRDHRARYVLSILESGSSSSDDTGDTDDTGKTVSVAVCYVDAGSGQICIREYEDDFRRSETERLFTCLRPLEIIVDKNAISKRVSKLVGWHADHHGATVIKNFEKGFPVMTPGDVAKYLDSERPGYAYDNVCSYVQARKLGARVFGAVTSYLASLLVDEEILSLGNYELFPPVHNSNSSFVPEDGEVEDANDRLPEPFGKSDQSSKRIRMDASTLASLEVTSNNLDGSERNTLLSYIDHASTPAGRRLLKMWIEAPLSSSVEINDRLNAVDAFLRLDVSIGREGVSTIAKQLSAGQDLTRALPRLHKLATVEDKAVMFDNTNQKRVKAFVKTLRSLKTALQTIADTRSELAQVGCESKRLNWLVQENGAVPEGAAEKLAYFLTDAFDVNTAESAGELHPKKGVAPDYEAKRDARDAVERRLDDELKKWQRTLGDKKIKFYHHGKTRFQLNVPVKTLKGRNIPREFESSSESKSTHRFYTRVIRDLANDHEMASEDFDAASQNVVREIVSQFDKHFDIWSAVARTSAELDALIGLSRASMGDGEYPMCRPEVLSNDHPCPVFEVQALRHPVLAAAQGRFVANDIALGDASNPRIAILTGPNAGGKSTLSRQIAVCALLVQVGCYAPARSFRFRPFEDIFVRMGASDDIFRGLSTFMMEMEDVSNILNNASSSSLCLLDEVGRGTSTFDGYAIAYAALQYLTTHAKCISIFSTHYSSLGADLLLGCDDAKRGVGTFQMAANVNEQKKEIKFLYKLQKGVTTHSRGICCARLAGIPGVIADDAEIHAAEFERALISRLDANSLRSAIRSCGDDDKM